MENRIFLFYVAPEFTMLAFSSALEALRLANQVIGRSVFEWRIVSTDGKPVTASCGLSLNPDLSLAQARELVMGRRAFDMAVVCAGRDVQRHVEKNLNKWLRECRKRRIALAGICTGPYLLAHAGLLKEKRCTIHWENYPAFVERFSDAQPTAQIYEVDDGIYTSAGGVTSFDMMLHIIAQEYGPEVARKICQQAIVGAIRHRTERQRLPFSLAQDVCNEVVKRAVQMMEDNVTDALSPEEIASRIGLSRRQLERLFRKELDCSPSRYYLRLRIERSKGLIAQTGMPIIEIAVACGFVSASHFSKVYREFESVSPAETRRQMRPAVGVLSSSALAA